MVTAGVTAGVIVIVTPREVTGLGLAQGELEVSTQVTTSPFSGS
jgi:hypothetical protein